MKKIFAYGILAALVALMSGCSGEMPFVHEPGSPIAFGVSTGYDNGADTRTEYSGDIVGESPKYERINWVPGTDRIRILCEEVSNDVKFADYEVKSATNITGQQKSSATVKSVAANGLTWGPSTVDHYFFALYPAATQEGVTASEAKLETAAGHKATVTGCIPDAQAVTWDSATRTYKPNMNYAYMYAAAKVNPQTADGVQLPFRSLANAFEVTLVALDPTALTDKLVSVTLSSTASALSGSFTATLSESGLEGVTVAEGSSTSVSASLGEGILLNDDPVRITLFALPVAQTNLTLELGFAGGARRTLQLFTSEGALSITAGQKLYISNVGVPGDWNYSIATPVSDIVVSGKQVLFPSDADASITVNKTRTGSTPRTAPWKAYFSLSEAAVGSSVQAGWSETPLPDSKGLDWLTLSAYSGSGNADNITMNLTASPKYDAAIDLRTSAKAMKNSMSARNLGKIDVSKLALSGGKFTYNASNSATTANCYVINGYGTFYIPLVYGNGIQGGVAKSAYNGASSGTEPYLRKFLNADGNAIASDYILSDGNLDKSGNYEARILWQDVLNSFEIIENADVAYVPAGNSDLSDVAALSCAYIKFKVNPYDETTGKGIKPGNAVIGLYDKTKDKILWSWHIWFTDESFSTIDLQYTSAGAKESHLNCALGWTPPISFTGGKTVLREQYVMIVCTETDTVVDVFKVRQALYDEGTFPSTLYTSTYYQWGRKDPFLPGRVNGDSAYNRPVTSSEDPYDLQITSTSTAVNNTFAAIPGSDTRAMKVAWMIRNPYSFLAQKNVHPDYLNLWNATSAVKFDRVTSPDVTKSVYDPSPRGFRLPRGCSYYGTQPPESIYKSGVLWKEREAQGAEIPSGMMLDRGYRNYSSSGAASPVFFPAIGYRHRVWPGDVGGLLMDLGPAGSCKGYYWTSISEGVGGSSLGFASNDHQLVAFEHEYAFCVRPVAE